MLEKQKAVLQEFDPLHTLTLHKLDVNQGQLLPLVAGWQPNNLD